MNIAVIFAGGAGTRMHSKDKPKQFLEIHGKPILIHTLENFENHSMIDAIVVSCIPDWISYCENIINKFNIKKVRKIIAGGKTGQESIYKGLCAAKEISLYEKSIVLIHDGVRPLINENLISNNIECVKKYGSAISCVSMKETVLLVEDEKFVDTIPNRNDCRMARAPQSFWLDEILDVHNRAINDGNIDFIDSCSLMKYYGQKLYLVDSPTENIKVTTPDDFYILRALLDAREDLQIYRTE